MVTISFARVQHKHSQSSVGVLFRLLCHTCGDQQGPINNLPLQGNALCIFYEAGSELLLKQIRIDLSRIQQHISMIHPILSPASVIGFLFTLSCLHCHRFRTAVIHKTIIKPFGRADNVCYVFNNSFACCTKTTGITELLVGNVLKWVPSTYLVY